jgi:O-antigen/teichoic acid export membrane protein
MTRERTDNRILVGGSWLMAGQAVERVIGLVSIAILARLLTPTDFGIVAVAGTVVAMVELLSAFGFDWALVRHREPSTDYLNSAWTLRVLLGLLTFAALGLLGPVAAAFYRLPPLKTVLLALGLSSFLASLENVGTVYFRREFAFHKEFLLRAVSKLAGFLVTVSVALNYRSYWALVAGILAVRSSSTAASYALHPYRPRPTLASARELFGFSSWLLIGNIVDYCRERFSDLYLGRVFGPRANGLFSVAGELSRMPITEVATPINRVAYSKYSEDIRANRGVAGSYLEIASFIWMISLPMCAGLIIVATEVVALLLGPRWEDAESVIRLLALGAVFTVMTANTHYVYWAVGHSRIVAGLSAVGAAIIVPVTIVCSHLAGYKGVALAYALTSAALVPVNFALLRRLAGVGFADLWYRVWRVTLAAIVMLVTLFFTMPQQGHETASAAARVLLMKVALGVTTYVATAAALWLACGRPDGPERRALQLAQQRTQRRTKAPAPDSEIP